MLSGSDGFFGCDVPSFSHDRHPGLPVLFRLCGAPKRPGPASAMIPKLPNCRVVATHFMAPKILALDPTGGARLALSQMKEGWKSWSSWVVAGMCHPF